MDLRANRVPGSDLIIVTAYDVTDEVTRQQVERQQARLERVQLRQIIEAQREIAACEDVAEAFAATLAESPASTLAKVELKRMDPFTQYAMVAAREAWADAGSPEVEPARLASAIGTGIGGVQSLLDALVEAAGATSDWTGPIGIRRS